MARNTCHYVGIGQLHVHLGICLSHDKPYKFSHCRCFLFSTPSSFKVVARRCLIFCIHSHYIVYSYPFTYRAHSLKEESAIRRGIFRCQKFTEVSGFHRSARLWACGKTKRRTGTSYIEAIETSASGASSDGNDTKF